MYEQYSENEKARLVFDIEQDFTKNPNMPEKFKTRDEYLQDMIDSTIELTNTELTKYTKVKPKIIILTANTETKISTHIIYVNIVFQDIYVMGHFVNEIKSDYIDRSIYANRCLRLLWNRKYGKNNVLELHNVINYDYSDNENLFYDSMVLPQNNKYELINYIKKDDTVKKTNKNQNKKENIKENIMVTDKKKIKEQIININNDKYRKIPLDEIQKYVNLLNIERCNEYALWIKVGYVIHNCNKDAFNIWNNWSKKGEKYEETVMMNKWKSFKKSFYGFTYLKYYAKKDNPEEFNKLIIKDEINKELYKSTHFEKEYLLEIDEKIKNKSSIVSKNVCLWLENANIKTLCVKAPYDTGKTQMNHKILTEFNFKKILIVSYRQSLTSDLYGNFKKHNITSYLDGFENTDRIICQVDSLPKLVQDLYDECTDIPKYDLIIIDESESVISQVFSDMIKDKIYLFDFFQGLLTNCTKILLLDGDFSNRSFEFIKDLGQSIVIQNNYKKCDRKYIFTNDQSDFETKIDNDLKNKKNVIIVSMTSNMANEFYRKYEKTYKSVIHCSDSDDSIKKKLIDVNSYWNQFQLVIYTPTVLAGINFSKEHFDEMYVILSKQSISPRDLTQMMARCRKIKNKTSYMLLNGFTFYENSRPYTYEEVECHIHSIYNQYLVKTVSTRVDGTKMIEYKNNLFTKMLIYHEMENLNKQPFYFISELLKLIKNKGGTYEYIDHKTKGAEKCYHKKDEIIAAADIDQDEFEDVLLKQKNNDATKEDKLSIEKFMYKNIWKIEEVNEEFMDKFYQKTPILCNLRLLVNEEIQKPIIKNIEMLVEGEINQKPPEELKNIDYLILSKGQYNIDFDKCKKLKQKEVIKKVIKLLGFDDVFDKRKIDRNLFLANIKILLKDSLLFKFKDINYPLLGLSKTSDYKIMNKEPDDAMIKPFLGFINIIFKEWGVCY